MQNTFRKSIQNTFRKSIQNTLKKNNYISLYYIYNG